MDDVETKIGGFVATVTAISQMIEGAREGGFFLGCHGLVQFGQRRIDIGGDHLG